MGPPANNDRRVRLCHPEEIVVLVDGDDFLAHAEVLTRLNTIYQDPDVWLTLNQFARASPRQHRSLLRADPIRGSKC